MIYKGSIEECPSVNVRTVQLFDDLVNRRNHPAWIALVMTFGGYGGILLVMFVRLFLVPFPIFLWF